MAKCEKGKDPPKDKKPARYVCKRCGLKARKKRDLCKPKKL